MNNYWLSHGKHKTREEGMCAMEWVAYVAGEEHTDAPQCVGQDLQEFAICFNDAAAPEMRQRLRPYLARCIGTNTLEQMKSRNEIFMEFMKANGIAVGSGWRDLGAICGRYRPEEGLALFDALLPKEIIQMPVRPEWEELCQVKQLERA